MPKSKAKPTVTRAAKASHKPTARPVSRHASPRMRETSRATNKSKTKARPAMTTTAAAEPRGAGNGENAVATRDRQYNENRKGAAPVKSTTYEKGDILKGRIDPANPDRLIAHRDRRAYLVDQAEKNEAANDELNAIQVEQNSRLQFAQNLIQDPDEQRENSMPTAINALKMHDPDNVKKQHDELQKRHKLQAERQRKERDGKTDK
jgi:hypothetical protein